MTDRTGFRPCPFCIPKTIRYTGGSKKPMAMSPKPLCTCFQEEITADPCRGPPDKKVSKEPSEDLPYGPQTPQTAQRGSEPTAARGGGREVSEWQRSAGNKPASSGEVSAGHRNRSSNQVFSRSDCILAAPFGNPLEIPQKKVS